MSYVNDRTGRAPSKVDMKRITALAVPPAWTDVWIAADPDSHVQATGRDAKGRKQFRYHPDFVADRASNKFASLVEFSARLGPLRRRVDRDLRASSMSYDRVVATVVRLLDLTSLRVGNEEYARTNRSFGLTTLRNRHAVVNGSTIQFRFIGKSAKRFDLTVENRRLAKVVSACQDLTGQRLFEYEDVDGTVRPIGSQDVNAYLSEHAAPGTTAKTFRTWNATVMAAELLAEAAQADEPTKRVVTETVRAVASELGNTPTVCRTSYVHPFVIVSYLDGSLLPAWQRPAGAKPTGLTVAERKTTRLLRRQPKEMPRAG
jgi:DNA topoisomerase-1